MFLPSHTKCLDTVSHTLSFVDRNTVPESYRPPQQCKFAPQRDPALRGEGPTILNLWSAMPRDLLISYLKSHRDLSFHGQPLSQRSLHR
jgi:hypothetical protein